MVQIQLTYSVFGQVVPAERENSTDQCLTWGE